MADSKTPKPPSHPVAAGSPKPAGRVVHDERGNAIWDWLKETSRIAIESTSRLLKKLETPELQIDDDPPRGLSLEEDRDPGGGYDPYNQSKTPRRPARK